MTKILSIHSGPHDSAAALFDDYRLVAAVHQERVTRKKGDGHYPGAAIDEVLGIAGIARKDVQQIVMSRGSYPVRWMRFSALNRMRFAMHRKKGHERHKGVFGVASRVSSDAQDVWLSEKFLSQEGFTAGTPVYFANHHNAHALSALFHMPTGEPTLLYTADGGGDGVYYSARVLKDGALTCLFGDTPESQHVNSLGLAYGYCTKLCGFRMNRHEGKLTGLAAYGKPELAGKLAAFFTVGDDGQISTGFTTTTEMERAVIAVCKGQPRETIAASIQQVLEDAITDAVTRMVKAHGIRRIGLAGGVFANVRMNACIAAIEGVDEVFIYPAMGDDGLVAGGALEFLMRRDGLSAWLDQRVELRDVYLGRGYPDADAVFAAGAKATGGDPVPETADLLAAGEVGAIFSERMEFGPRALGARTILANPSNADVNQTINDRLNRSEFMPFAPFVGAADAERVFAIDGRNRYACRFMTITTPVHDEWREKIPAVVHVDGTARPQIIDAQTNPLYAAILERFKQVSGLPVLVNTSFNAHEEPIINTPEQALTALLNDRVDFLVTDKAVYRRG